MSKILYVFVFAALALSLVSCKKEGSGSSSSKSAAIQGRWLTIKTHTLIYTTAGVKVKDTTEVYANDVISNSGAWYETYDADGKGAVIAFTGSASAHPDTSEWYTYKVVNNTVTIYQFGDVTSPETSQIISVDANSMDLEEKYTATPSSGWGLDVNTNYNFVEDDYYNKQ